MPRGGARKGAGRKKGVPTRRGLQSQSLAAKGMLPLEYMLAVMRDESVHPDRRFEAAKAAAPYVHPKLASVENTGPGGGPMEHKVSVIEIAFVKPKGE